MFSNPKKGLCRAVRGASTLLPVAYRSQRDPKQLSKLLLREVETRTDCIRIWLINEVDTLSIHVHIARRVVDCLFDTRFQLFKHVVISRQACFVAV